MSSPFNYEIDEKNLRKRLREMSVPYREDAWIQFESYSEYNKSAQKSRHIPEFSLRLGRNVIIPAVFFCAILLLSFVLYNFISIKNNSKAEVKEEPKITPTAEPKQEKVPVVVTDIVKVDTPVKDSLPPAPTVTVNTITVTNSVVLTPTVNNTPSLAVKTNSSSTDLVAISAWYIPGACDVYESPNIASKVIGSISGGKNYSIYEITNYFIKVKYDAGNYGFILKRLAATAEGQTAASKKKKTAEEMESKPLNSMLPTSAPKSEEPELKL